jgi:tetratricopeptide (TPR) repeat protein
MSQEAIIDKYLKNGAWQYHYLSKEWEEWIEKGLQQDSSIAYLWQQRAIPLWKQKKYNLAISYYEKAVQSDPERWLARLGFLKCIFAKDYLGSNRDLKAYLQKFGSTYEQDHPLEFYIGLNYLQTNQLEKAHQTLQQSIIQQEKQQGSNWAHYLEYYYLAISQYELGNYQAASTTFETVLKKYPEFSDALFYKSICENYLGNKTLAKELAALGKDYYQKGSSFNEDSNLYETYPYQISWQWQAIDQMIR